MPPIKILIVEDDSVSALNLKMSLENYRYDVIGIVSDTLSARNKIKIYNPDVVLIDIELQDDSDGIALAHFIRTQIPSAFIYLTSHSEQETLIMAQETEPYGYIVKPFDPVNLHTTIQMALYRFAEEQKRRENLSSLEHDKAHLEKLLYATKHSDASEVLFGGGKYRFDIALGETYYEDVKIKLTKKENAFIRLLLAQLGSVVDFDQAVDYVWPEKGASGNSVRTLVWRLRAKLPTDLIQNASGIGYYIEA